MKYFYTFILIFLVFLLVGCTFSTSTNVIDFTIDLSELPDKIYNDNFELSDIKLNVTNQDNTTSIISLDESMLTETDLEKLQTPGNHEILVTYHSIKKTFNIEILQKKFKVTFLDFDGNIFNEQIILEGENAQIPNYNKITGYKLTGFSSNDYQNVSKFKKDKN